MLVWLHDWHALRHNGANAGGCQAYWTKIAVHRFLVNDVATLPIL
jgi:hypothetical protein